jgi:hypothetical protein
MNSLKRGSASGAWGMAVDLWNGGMDARTEKGGAHAPSRDVFGALAGNSA